MYVGHIGFRLWLTRWFGIRRSTNAGDDQIEAGQPGVPPDSDEPLFSLGDTKQDVVVSYRAAQPEEL
ncbi:MAG: hypothetical protein OER80_14175 [Gammaproteobacteria bacterium]|nr:hypothetical protein [Gammaproteobacteria bacterium]MDH3767425.1 hypothetical protein [Gammaproteobacteria bacterium]